MTETTGHQIRLQTANMKYSIRSVGVSSLRDVMLKGVSCHHVKTRRQIDDEVEGVQILKETGNILNDHRRTADKEMYSGLGVT